MRRTSGLGHGENMILALFAPSPTIFENMVSIEVSQGLGLYMCVFFILSFS